MTQPTIEALPAPDVAEEVSPEVSDILTGKTDAGASRRDVDDFLDMIGEFTFGGDDEQIRAYKRMARPLLLWLGFDGVLIPITTMGPKVRLFAVLGVIVLAAVVVKVRQHRKDNPAAEEEVESGDRHERETAPSVDG